MKLALKINDLAPGNVVWIHTGPSKGTEQDGKRPVVILSDAHHNFVTGRVTVVPCTTTVRGLATEIAIQSLPVASVALIDQLMTLDWRARSAEFRGQAVSAVELANIRTSIRYFLKF